MWWSILWGAIDGVIIAAVIMQLVDGVRTVREIRVIRKERREREARR
jgi:hypothetical protein